MLNRKGSTEFWVLNRKGSTVLTFPTELAYPKTFHQTESWNVRERACLPGNVPSNKMVRFHPSWLTRKRSIEQGGTLSTEMAYPKTFHRKVGCQNGIEKSSFFVRRSRNRHFPRAKKPFHLMERDGTFSIGKMTNRNHLRAGLAGLPDGATFPRRPGSAEKVPSNDPTFPSDGARLKTFHQMT